MQIFLRSTRRSLFLDSLLSFFFSLLIISFSSMEKCNSRIIHENNRTGPTEEVKLAAIALSLNVRLGSSDMPLHMQERALRYARLFLDDSAPRHRPNHTHLARALKKEFDKAYGPAWHCVVGTSFGSFVTHSPSGFLHFSIEPVSVLLFKTEVQLVTELEPLN